MKPLVPNIKISAIAACVPNNVFDVRLLGKEFGELEVEKIISSTGISKLRIADDKTCCSDLCEAAARELINSKLVDKEDIDGIVFISQTPDYILPVTSLSLQKRLRIGTNCIAFDITYGCSAYIYGLFQGALLVSSGSCKKVLVCAGDKITPYVHPKDRSIKLLFGDGGSATIIEKGEDTLFFDFFSDGNGGENLIIPSGRCRYPLSEQSKIATEREGGNFRSDENLYMDGIEIMNFALREVPKSVKNVCENAGWNINDINMFGFHQANAFMLKYIAKIMKVPIEKIPIAMCEIGNTGPASIPLMLTEARERISEKNMLNKVVLCGFGVGLSCASVALTLKNTKILNTVEYEHTI